MNKLLLAEFLGALSGDGFIGNYGSRKQQYMIQFTGHAQTDKNYLHFLQTKIHKLFGQQARYIEKENTARVYFYSKDTYTFLHKQQRFPTGKKGNNLTIPPWILEEKNYLFSFIRGIFDTDGCLYFDKRTTYKNPYPRILLEIISQKLFKQISSSLTKHFRVRTSSKQRSGRQRIYVLEIYGHKQLLQWNKLIGFRNEKHLSKMPPWLSGRDTNPR